MHTLFYAIPLCLTLRSLNNTMKINWHKMKYILERSRKFLLTDSGLQCQGLFYIHTYKMQIIFLSCWQANS